ncbi:hypothetical protein [Pseudanabaena sp. Chao 1811]|uniref:hypothetical protein n=1 Tax=Pseudanabaena sp. Chao 1811 TaxID=2963092 RepID=UPI0022F38166|nr:hypothetical protein [Pseudanabaena sp. Chao 1811]
MSDINIDSVKVEESIININKDGTQIITCQSIHGKGCMDSNASNDSDNKSDKSPENCSQPIESSLPVEDYQKKKTTTNRQTDIHSYDNMEYPKPTNREKLYANSESSQRLLYLSVVYLTIFGVIIFSIKFVENWWMLPIAILGSVLTFSTILTFHEIQEGTIDNHTFLSLMFENLKRLTMIQTLMDSILSFSQSSSKSNSIKGRRTRKK